MEIVFGFVIFCLSGFILYSASKNSFRSKMIDDFTKNSNLAAEALEKGDFKLHLEYKKKSEKIYSMIRQYDYSDRNTHWRL